MDVASNCKTTLACLHCFPAAVPSHTRRTASSLVKKVTRCQFLLRTACLLPQTAWDFTWSLPRNCVSGHQSRSSAADAPSESGQGLCSQHSDDPQLAPRLLGKLAKTVSVSKKMVGELEMSVSSVFLDSQMASLLSRWLTMITQLSIRTALTCTEDQRAWPLAPSQFGKLVASCRKNL